MFEFYAYYTILLRLRKIFPTKLEGIFVFQIVMITDDFMTRINSGKI